MTRNRVISSRTRRSGDRLPVAGGLKARLGSRASKVAGVVLLAGCLTVFAGSLVLRGESVYSPFWDGWVGNLALIVPTLACVVRAALGGPRRAAVVWLALGMASFSAGNVIHLRWTQFDPVPPVPSLADFGYLGICPCVAAAVICILRRERGSTSRSLWLDGALDAAGAATVLAAVLNPVLSGVEGDLREV